MRYVILSLLALAAPVQGEQRTNLQVVELFTSQGCSSCPPADALLSDVVAQASGVLPLAFHVDYWNYLGWEDELSAPFATQRQVIYRDAMGATYVYTPQFVVGGAQEFSLRRVPELVTAIEQEATQGLAMAWTEEGLALTPVEGGLSQGHIWRVEFTFETESDIRSGENAGRTLTYHHGVTHIESIGTWANAPQLLAIEAPEDFGVAILVSDAKGHIHGAADWRNLTGSAVQ